MQTKVPHQIRCTRRLSLEALYDSVLEQKAALEAAGFQCPWEFLDAGKRRTLFVGNTNYTAVPSLPVTIATLHYDLPGDQFSLLMSYDRNNGLVNVHGSVKVHGDRKKYHKVCAAIDSFKEVTGIELSVEYSSERLTTERIRSP